MTSTQSSAIQVFQFQQEYEVRTVEDGGMVWFVASDVCRILEITDTRQAVERLGPDEKGKYIIPTPGGPQNMWAVNEPGLYRLMLTSRVPKAKELQRWIAHEVIPSIMRTGRYEQAEQELLNEELCRMLDALSGRNLKVAMRYIASRLAFLGVGVPSTRQRITRGTKKLPLEEKALRVLERHGPTAAAKAASYANVPTVEARAALDALVKSGVIGCIERPAKRGSGYVTLYYLYSYALHNDLTAVS